MHELAEHVAGRFQSAQHARGGFSVHLLAVHEHDPDAAVLSVYGDVDLATAPILQEAMRPVLARRRGRVIVDLSEVPFMDSSGVHVLVDAHQRLGSQDRGLAIACREHGPVHRLLVLVGLLDVVTVHRSRAGAVIGGDRIRSGPSARRFRRYAEREPAMRRSSETAAGERRG